MQAAGKCLVVLMSSGCTCVSSDSLSPRNHEHATNTTRTRQIPHRPAAPQPPRGHARHAIAYMPSMPEAQNYW